MNMDLQKQGQLLDGRIKSIQIISFALLLGATFTVIIFCAIADWQAVHQNFNLLSIIGLGYGAVSVVAALFVPSLFGKDEIDAAQKASSDLQSEKLAGAFLVKHIIRMALLEGGAFLNAILFFIEKNMLTLCMAVFLIAMMAMFFPRKNSILSWIEANQA